MRIRQQLTARRAGPTSRWSSLTGSYALRGDSGFLHLFLHHDDVSAPCRRESVVGLRSRANLDVG
jgi:hypothetical protein